MGVGIVVRARRVAIVAVCVFTHTIRSLNLQRTCSMVHWHYVAIKLQAQ